MDGLTPAEHPARGSNGLSESDLLGIPRVLCAFLRALRRSLY